METLLGEREVVLGLGKDAVMVGGDSEEARRRKSMAWRLLVGKMGDSIDSIDSVDTYMVSGYAVLVETMEGGGVGMQVGIWHGWLGDRGMRNGTRPRIYHLRLLATRPASSKRTADCGLTW